MYVSDFQCVCVLPGGGGVGGGGGGGSKAEPWRKMRKVDMCNVLASHRFTIFQLGEQDA